jgi:mono/diheme cytochrome c family protein
MGISFRPCSPPYRLERRGIMHEVPIAANVLWRARMPAANGRTMKRPFALATAVLMLCSATGLLAARRPSPDVTEGRVLYTRYCASCHGLTADGRGPVAPLLSRPPADLRRLAARYGSPLPADRIARFIDGRDDVGAHGARDMPVWGERFRVPEPEQSGRKPGIDPRIRAIVLFLASVQTVPEGAGAQP